MALVIFVTYTISVCVSCYFLNDVIKTHDEEVAKLVVADVYDTMHNEILKATMVSNTMAHDSFLKQNLKGELNFAPNEEISIMQNYLSGIKENFGYNITFIISAATKNYYYDGGFNRKVDVENNPNDFWYKNFLDKNLPQAVLVEPNEFNKDSWNVFINSRIEDEAGNLLGICGIGLPIENLQAILNQKEDAHKIKIDLFHAEENFDIDTNAVKFKEPYLKDIILKLQQSETFDINEIFLETIDDDFFAGRYIPETNTYLIIRREDAHKQGIFSNLVLQILGYSGVVLVILLLFVQFKVGKEHTKITEESKRQGLTSHADKYASMHVIDLKYNTVREISRHEGFNLLQIRDGGNAARKIKNSLISSTKYETLRALLYFIDFETLAHRIEGKRAISYEFMSKEYGWCRANFILLDNIGKKSGEQIVFAIEVIEEEKRRAEELRRKSETDLMTGLRNRGSGEKAIRELIAGKVAGMFCLMDADKFKGINDNFGHDVGDKVIKSIANALKRTFRNNDIVMRLGGDEYAVYAVGVTDAERGKALIQRLFKEIDDIYISELAGKRKITISLGSAFFDGKENISFEEVYKRADSGTYHSKKVQGNCHTLFEEIENND